MGKISHIYFELIGNDYFLIKYDRTKPILRVSIGDNQVHRREGNMYIFEFSSDDGKKWSIVVDADNNQIINIDSAESVTNYSVNPENMKLLIKYYDNLEVNDWF